MRSLLFVPGDSTRKLEKGMGSGADALIIDLEDSVALSAKDEARRVTAHFLAEARREASRPRLLVRVNGLTTGLTDADLDGITRVVAIATETARGVFALGTFAGASHRLAGLTWGGEDLSADLGAEANRGPDGAYTEPYRLARALTLLGAAAAEVDAIDSVFTNFRDMDGLAAECREARRDGFVAKMAIHPAQVPVINEAFTPAPEALAWAEMVIQAFAAQPDAGVVGVNGEMLDRPHLRRAQRLLQRVSAGASTMTASDRSDQES